MSLYGNIESAVWNFLADTADEFETIKAAGELNEWVSRVLTNKIKVARAQSIQHMIDLGYTPSQISERTGLGLPRIAKYRDVAANEGGKK